MGVVYWTDFALNTINQLDLSSGTNTVIETKTFPPSVDSIIVVGNVLYYTLFWGQGVLGTGSVRSYNLNTLTDAQLATGFSDECVDLILDPSGTTITVSDRANNELVRVTISGGATANFASVSLPNGTAYDLSGNLFVVTWDAGRTHTILVKLDGTTGAVLATGATLSGIGDGACYDRTTGLIWVGWDDGTLKAFSTADCSLQRTSVAVSTAIFDGVATSGDGNILVCDTGFGVIRSYSVGSNTWTAHYQPAGMVQPDDLCIPALLEVACNNPGAATIGEPYTAGPSASGGTPPYTYSISVGSLPPGLSMNASTGAISGIPRNTGTFSFTVHVTDSAANTANVTCSISATGPGGAVNPSNPGLGATDFVLKKVALAMKKDPKLPVRGAAQ